MQNNYIYHKLDNTELPNSLKVINSPPKQLFYRGQNINLLLKNKKSVSIVGSRKPTLYGREVTNKIARELSSYDVIITSGLALGVDGIAHQATLDAGGTTIAVLPCGIDQIYPSTHKILAKKILESGGSLVSEYPERTTAQKQNFIARNRLVSGLSDILIITEAAEKSGTLHTANFALAQGKTVMAVPGPITSPLSKGTNNLIKSGAAPITDISDILFTLEISANKTKTQINAKNEQEYIILSLISSGVSDGHELQLKSQIDPQIFNQTLTMLEINGQIIALGANQWTLS